MHVLSYESRRLYTIQFNLEFISVLEITTKDDAR